MRWGRRFLVFSLVTSLLALSALVLIAASAAAIPGVDCNETHYRILFWPKGHGAVKSAGFPVFAPPHTEVYAGTGKTFADAQEKGYVDAQGAKTATTGCTPKDSGTGSGTMNKKSSKQVMLVCTFSSSPVLVGAGATGGGAVILLYVKGSPQAAISIGPSGNRLNWSSKACKSKKSPK